MLRGFQTTKGAWKSVLLFCTITLVAQFALSSASALAIGSSAPVAVPTVLTYQSPVVGDSTLQQISPYLGLPYDQELSVREQSPFSQRAILKYDLSAIPDNATVLSATARFWVTQSGANPVRLHRVIESWSESLATWDSKSAAYDPVAVATFTPSAASQFVSVDVTGLVQEWLVGAKPNYGIMLVAAAPNEQTKYGSRESSVAGQRPSLEVVLALESIADDFDTGTGYDGSSGTLPWSSNWQELGESDGPTTGRVTVKSDATCAAGKCLQIGANSGSLNGVGAVRMLDLHNTSSARLSFDLRRTVNASLQGAIKLQVSVDGGIEWSTLAVYNSLSSDNDQIPQVIDLSSYLGHTVQLRFVGTGSISDLNRIFIDNLRVVFAPFATGVIGGRLWSDANRDGLINTTETGLAGVTVHLFSGSCAVVGTSPIQSVQTLANGHFSFSPNAAGDYCFTVEPSSVPAGFVATTNNLPLDIPLAVGGGFSEVQVGYASALAGDRLSVNTYFPCQDTNWLQQIAQTHQGVITLEDRRACSFLVEAAATAMDDLRQDVEQNPQTVDVQNDAFIQGSFTPNDPDYNNASKVYGPQQISAPGAWDVTLGRSSVIVAILDTGLDLNHPEFAGRILPGYDFVNNDADPTDDHGHGTHVAGIAVAGINNGIGIAGIAGNAKLLPVKVLASNNTGWWSDVAAGVTWATDQGADVINLSIVGSSSSTALQNAISYALSKGVAVVGSSGNENVSAPRYPASYDTVIAVGATTSTNTRWSLSNYGTNVDIMAPGSSVYSTHWSATSGSTYRFLTGTSMAAPHVAGLVALMLSVNPNLTVEEIRQILQSTATDMGDAGYDSLHGYGKINAQTAVASVTPAAPVLPTTTMDVSLVVDGNGNGYVEPGDKLRYTIVVANNDATALNDVRVIGQPVAHSNYVAGTATVNTILVADNTSPPAATVLPLDEDGLNIGSIPSQNSSRVTFDVTVNTPNPVTYSISAEAQVQSAAGTQIVSATLPIGGTACDLLFTSSAGGSAALSYAENGLIYVELRDADANTSANVQQNVNVVVTNLDNNDQEMLVLVESGLNTGIFRASMQSQAASSGASGDGVLRATRYQVISARYVDPDFTPDVCVTETTIIPPVVAVPLYLSDPIRTLDRIDPAASGDTSTASTSILAPSGADTVTSVTFSQEPAVATNLELPIGTPVTLISYLTLVSGQMPAQPQINAELRRDSTTFATLTNPTYNNGLLTWSGQVAQTSLLASGSRINLVISTAEAGASFRIRYDSASAPSRLVVATSTPLDLQSFAVYDAAYPAGATVSALFGTRNAYLRATASSPFGAYAVTGVDLAIQRPAGCGGALAVSMGAANVVATSTSAKTYEYALNLANCGGAYSATATAKEGSEGITDAASAAFSVTAVGSIGDHVWHDLDGDGVIDVGEAGLVGVDVLLTNQAGAVQRQTTNADGFYRFDDLLAGLYTIALDQATLPANFELITTIPPQQIDLAAGQTFLAADFGLTTRATLVGDAIWYDADVDGLQDLGEPGIGNVTLDLYLDSDGNGQLNTSSDLRVDSTLSDALGAYLLAAPLDGIYFVDVTDVHGFLNGLTHLLTGQSLSDPTLALTLVAGQVVRTADFGYVRTPPAGSAVLSGRHWLDGNNDGVIAQGEQTLAGGEVCATPVGGGAESCATADLNGRYLLVLPAGSYDVTPSQPAAGVHAASAGKTVTLAAGEQQVALDFAFAADAGAPSALGGTIWQDAPVGGLVDGLFDATSETRLSNVGVNLYADRDANGAINSGDPIVATIANHSGDYIFPAMLAGDYLVEVSDTLNVLRYFVPSVLGPNPNADQNNHPQPYAVHLDGGETDTSLDFSYREIAVFGAGETAEVGMIGDQVWSDTNGDGVYSPSAGDLPLAGVTLALKRNGVVVAATTSAPSGQYRFSDLLPETYEVSVSDEFNVLAGFASSVLGSPGQDNNNQAQPYVVTLSPLVNENLTADFGYKLQPNVRRGDCNADSAINAGDLSALVLELFDGDGSEASGTLNAGFPGSGIGCDSNADTLVNAGDLSCTVLLLFGTSSCQSGGGGSSSATLTIGSRSSVLPGTLVTVPIDFDNGGNTASTLAFSVDIDEKWLTFSNVDGDDNGIPDAVTVNTPPGFSTAVTFNPNDRDGELDFTIADMSPPLATLPSGAIASVTFLAGAPSNSTDVPVSFSADPAPSSGSSSGVAIPSENHGGLVSIDGFFGISEVAVSQVVAETEPIRLNQLVTLTVQIVNSGSTIVTVLPLRDQFDPTYLAFERATTPPDSRGGGQVVWNDLTAHFGDLAPGASVKLELVLLALEDTSDLPNERVTNKAIAQGVLVATSGAPEAANLGPLAPVGATAELHLLRPTGQPDAPPAATNSVFLPVITR